ncbi:MFS transporter [Chloroflexota bacterium]
MKPGVIVKRPKKIFYGWWVILAGSIISAMGGGVYFYGFTAFFLPISTELGLSRTATSTVFAIARLEGGLEGPIVGWLIDRFGARKLLVIGLLFVGAGYIAMYWMNSFLMFIILYAVVISLGYNCGFSHAVYALANKWFIRQRSRATGVVSMAFGVGGAVIVPMLAWLIIQYGWRTTVVIAGTAVAVIGLLLCLAIRNLPEDKGALPDGDEVETKGATGKSGEATDEVSFAVRESMKTSAFWILCLSFILRLFVVGGIWVHMVPLLVFKDFDEQSAANAIGLLLIFTIPSRFIFGWLGDIYPKRYLLALCCLINTASLVIALTATSIWQVYLFVIIFALGYGVTPLNVAIIGDYFGRKNFATIRGVMTLVYSVGIITGPIYAGYIYDVTQSYQIAFITFIVLYALAGLAFLFARRPNLPARVTGYATP